MPVTYFYYLGPVISIFLYPNTIHTQIQLLNIFGIFLFLNQAVYLCLSLRSIILHFLHPTSCLDEYN